MNGSDDDSDGDGVLDDVDDTPYGMSECPVYTDCNGEEFGNAQYDCNGICGGESVTGDMNFDLFLDLWQWRNNWRHASAFHWFCYLF